MKLPIITTLTTVTALIAATTTTAATYQVHSCGAARTVGGTADDAWQPYGNADTITLLNNCREAKLNKDKQGLYLHDTLVTDAGLQHLSGLANLEILALERTFVTNAGVQVLQAAVPNCRIESR